ncbi:DUF6600 domain-containing protein [Ralstonia syzygii]|uniref:FecR protein domain-containing protein n=1 Tax=Ralstonia syzygii R24 TaxID=907261 RepID=G3A2P6_9RALS|nr:DUF6600 domain-containing protein [Ralstonia syzygii]CCA85697.1 conserved exported hypothetical protein [Ralstonia syzygii R24]
MTTSSCRTGRLSGPRLPRVLRAASLAAVLLVCGAQAALAADPASRVARLSDFSGAVSFAPAGSDDWAAATLNRPFTTGDRLWSDQGSRTELHVGSTALRLGQSTGATLVDLDDRTTQIKLTQGALSVRVRALPPDQVVEIDTPNLAFQVQEPGEYRLDVAPDGSTTTVTVWRGNGTAYGDDRSAPLAAGQQVRFGGTDLAEAGGTDYPNRDAFDRWAEARDAREDASASARYVGREMTGYEALDEYGTWREEDGYGAVWVPRAVPVGWAPYRTGHWAWVAPWGWTWVDDAPWGFAPFHYGRWAYVGTTWCWVPGPVVPRPVYAPALVAFVGGGGGGGVSWGINISIGSPGVAWFPLAPGEAYRPVYAASPTYMTNINRTVVVNNVTVNKTIINNNVTNVTNVNRVTYINANNPAALTAVPAKTFVNGQPVGPAMTTLRPEQMRAQLTHAQFVSTPALAPVKTSLVGAAAANGPHPLPPAQVFSRQALAMRAPQAPAGGHDPLAERFRSQGGALPSAGPAWVGGNAARVAPARGPANAGAQPMPAAAQAAGLRLTRATPVGVPRPGNEPGGPRGPNNPAAPGGPGSPQAHGAPSSPTPQALMAPAAPGAAARPGQPQLGAMPMPERRGEERPATPNAPAQAMHAPPQGPAGTTTRPPQPEGIPSAPRDERRPMPSVQQERPRNEPPVQVRPEPQSHPAPVPRQPEARVEAPRPMMPQPHPVEVRPPQPQPQPHVVEMRPPQPQPQPRPEARPPQPPQPQPRVEHHEAAPTQPHPQAGHNEAQQHDGERH